MDQVGFPHLVATVRPSPFLNHLDARFFLFEISLHTVEEAAHESLGGVEAVGETSARDHGAGSINFTELGHVDPSPVAPAVRA